MAYKNQKKNKRHIKELRADPRNWRKAKRKRTQDTTMYDPLSVMAEMEKLIKKL